METNLIEKYVIDEIERYKKENDELKTKILEYQKEIASLNNTKYEEESDYQMPILEASYGINISKYYIENHLNKIEEWLDNKNYDAIEDKINCYVITEECNYKLVINHIPLKLLIRLPNKYDKNGHVSVYIPREYKTMEEAQEKLIEEVRKLYEDIKMKVTEDGK